jgi:hypothetical protein
MTQASENFGSTAQIMLEALDKAAVELSKTVSECLEMVAISGLSLQKSLMFQLGCASANYQSFADDKFDDLDRRKQDILAQLQQFEESQIETIESTAKIVREAVMEYAESVVAQISEQLNENSLSSATIQRDPNVLLKDCYEMAKPALERTFNSGQQKLEQIFNTCSTESESKIHSCTNVLSQQVDAWNTRMSARMEETLVRFEQHINTIMGKLQSLLIENESYIDANSGKLTQQAESVLSKSIAAIDKSVSGWRSGLSSAYDDLGRDLTQAQEQEQVHTAALLGENLDEVSLYFTHLSSAHAEKAYETQRAYAAALDKIENACVQRLDHLREYFSSLLSGYNEQSTENVASEVQSTEEYRSRIEASLGAHSGQVVDAAQALVTQLEADLGRSSEFLNERIETIKSEAIDHFREQVKTVETEADRVTKEFRRGLSKFETSIKEIDDAGQASAVTVTAYLGTVLSLEE